MEYRDRRGGRETDSVTMVLRRDESARVACSFRCPESSPSSRFAPISAHSFHFSFTDFSDLRGFSKFSDRRVPAFFEFFEFLGSLSLSNPCTSESPRFTNFSNRRVPRTFGLSRTFESSRFRIIKLSSSHIRIFLALSRHHVFFFSDTTVPSSSNELSNLSDSRRSVALALTGEESQTSE